MSENNISPPIAYESTSLEAVRSAVGNGFGFTLLVSHPSSELTYDLKRVRVIRIRDAVRPLRIVLAKRQSRGRELLISRFVAQTVIFFSAKAGRKADLEVPKQNPRNR